MTFCIPSIQLDAIIAVRYLPPRSLEYRHGSVVTEERVEEVEVKSQEQELSLDQPWQLSEEVLEDFYDGPQDDVEEDVIDTKSLESNVPEVKDFGEKGITKEYDQIQTTIEEFEIFKLKRELEKKKQELVVKLETMGLRQKNLMERAVLSKGVVKDEDREKGTQEDVNVTGESLVIKEPKAIENDYYQDSSKELKTTNDDEIKKSSKIKKRRSRIVNPLMKKNVVKLSKAGRMKRDL